MRTMRVQSHNGHDTLTWDPADATQVEQVHKEFDELIARGFTAFAEPNRPNAEGQLLRHFDPEANILMTVPLQGG